MGRRETERCPNPSLIKTCLMVVALKMIVVSQLVEFTDTRLDLRG